MEHSVDDLLKKLEEDVKLLLEGIKEIQADMVKEGYTQMPVFIAHQGDVEIGEWVFDKEEYQTGHTFSVTTAEDLAQLGILKSDRVEAFKGAYGDPSIQTCILWVHGAGIRFIFFPLKPKSNS